MLNLKEGLEKEGQSVALPGPGLLLTKNTEIVVISHAMEG